MKWSTIIAVAVALNSILWVFVAVEASVSAEAPPDETVSIIMSQDVVAVRDVDGVARFLPVTKIQPCPEVAECPPCEQVYAPEVTAILVQEAQALVDKYPSLQAIVPLRNALDALRTTQQ